MSIVYFDSSAFVKLLINESGSQLAGDLWTGCDAAVASPLAYPEVRAALAAAHRSRRLRSAELERAEVTWERVWAATRPVEMTHVITLHAGQLARDHALSGADAMHLASLLSVGRAETVMAAWDMRLRIGAVAAGVQLVPRDLEPSDTL